MRLRRAGRDRQVLHIQASAKRSGRGWTAPYVRLLDAAFQRGHLLVDTGEELKVRGEKLTNARREDAGAEIQAAQIDRISMARFIGMIAMVLGSMIVLFVFIPATPDQRLINLGLGAVVLGGGLWLYLAGRKSRVVDR